MITFAVTSGYERVIRRSGKCSQRYDLVRPTYRLCSEHNGRTAIATSCLCIYASFQFSSSSSTFGLFLGRDDVIVCFLLASLWMFCRKPLLFSMVCLCVLLLHVGAAEDGIQPSTLVLYLKTRWHEIALVMELCSNGIM